MQALKLYPKRKLDCLFFGKSYVLFMFFLSFFLGFLRLPIGLVTALAFVKPSIDRNKDLKFRLSHLAVLMIALIYTFICMV